MTLRRRLDRLEARTPDGDLATRDAVALQAKMAALLHRVQARDNYRDRPAASPAERYHLAVLRDEAEMARGIIEKTLATLR